MFNQAMLTTGGIILELTYAGGTSTYVIESQLIATHGVGSGPGVTILLNVTGEASILSITEFAIDGNSLDDDAILIMTLSADIKALGGNGGKGGNASPPPPLVSANAGAGAQNGGSAIRLGCDTTIKGSGTIRGGYGGGGGGAGHATGSGIAGSGGGGGAPDGTGGAAGSGPSAGGAGDNATASVGGAGGTTNHDGGQGASDGVASTAGETSPTHAGGAAGSNGFTVAKQGFTLTKEGSVVYVGSEQA